MRMNAALSCDPSYLVQNMTSNEVKRLKLVSANGASAAVDLNSISKPLQEMKQELVPKSDRWGKGLPSCLLAPFLSYVGALEFARSQAVCQRWKLAPNLLERLWRNRYEADW